MRHRPLTVVVLAAGEGTRMKSPGRPKVLHGFAGRSMLGHVLAAAAPLAADRTVVVVGHRADDVRAHLAQVAPAAATALQSEQRGTGHAVQTALDAVAPLPDGQVLVLLGDAPLLTAETLHRLVDGHTAVASLVTSVLPDPTGYGRVLRTDDGDGVVGIVEEKDASPEQRAIAEVATYPYVFDEALLRDALSRVQPSAATGELYLTDVIAILAGDGRRVEAVPAPATETAGINDRVQLAAAHGTYNCRLLEAHMRAGVTVVDPASTWIDAEVELGVDVRIEPQVDLHGRTVVGDGALLGPQTSLTDTTVGERSTLERVVAKGARIGADASLGPFVYLRPGAELADGVHIGTYVEVKNSQVGPGSKVPHLSYVGDATIGAGVNVGAATVFVNYDGAQKHRSVIGDHAFIGSDSMIVAPREIGAGAFTAAGSVITEDVPPGAMAVARGRQRNVAGWVERKRPGTAAADAAAAANATAPSDTAPTTDDGATDAERDEA